MNKKLNILVVDDDAHLRKSLADILGAKGYTPIIAGSGQEALARIETETPLVALIDLKLEDMSGLTVMKQIKTRCPATECIVLTGYASQDSAIEAVNLGAYGYVQKPYDMNRLLEIIHWAMEKHEAGETLQTRAAQLALLNDIGSKIAAVLDLDSVLAQAVHLVQQSFGYHHVALFTLNKTQDELVMRARAGDFTHFFPPDHRLKLDQGLIGRVYQRGQTLLANNVAAEPHFFNPYPDVIPTAAELSIPLRIGENIVGVLDLQSATPDAFSENDVVAMEALASQVAVAIENARLYAAVQQELAERKQTEEKLRQRNRELGLLNQIIAASAASPGPETILEAACRGLSAVFDVAQATVALLNEEKTQAVVMVEYAATALEPGQSVERPLVVGQTLPVKDNPAFQSLLNHSGPLVIDDVQNDPRLAPLRGLMFHRDTVSTLLLVPLVDEEQVQGLMCLGTLRPRHFSPEEISLAWGIADQVTGALARAALVKTQQRLTTAIEQVAEMVVITDAQGAIIYVNPTFERITGYSRAEALGQNSRLLQSGRQEIAFYQAMWATLRAGQVWHGHFVNKKKDGALYTEEATISPMKDEHGVIVNYVAVKRDVTQELQLEEQYRQAQKMEAIGQLTAGIAHDFNNLLTAINGFAELAQFRLASDHPLQEMLGKILHSGQRAAGLVAQLMAFSRKQIMEVQVVSLNTVVANMDKMLQRIIGEHITLKTVLLPDLWPVKVDPTRIEQVIVNLAVNARDAMPGGGRLTIETANVTLDQEYAARHLEVQPGEYVSLIVSDNGAGMSEEVKAHLFEPFFTTKAQGQGTGLGLATVFGIVKQSGGHLWVYSEVGQGSAFKIYLPRVRETATPVSPPEDSRDLPRGQETILLVEDEAVVRQLTADMLLQLGYTVLEAANGQEARRLAQEFGETLQLLLTDVVMPNINGKALAAELGQMRPGLKTLFISGYTDEAIVHHGVLEPGVAFLQKPFTMLGLARKVRAVLDAAPVV